MPWVGFQPTIPALERAKTVDASERDATVLGESEYSYANTNGQQCELVSRYFIGRSK
jgi:hypothetical protein